MKKNNQYQTKAAIFVGRREKAIYREAQLDQWKGNPYLEALPPVPLTDDEIIEHFTLQPAFDECDRDLPSQLRLAKLSTLDQILQPTRNHVTLFNRVSGLLRSGYEGRNPIPETYFDNIPSNVDNFMKNLDAGTDLGTSKSTSIFGLTTVGKTRAIRRTLSYYPQVIEHSRYKDHILSNQQLVYLLIECPPDGREKGLLTNFFMNFDKVLHTNYLERYVGKSLNVQMTGMVEAVQSAGLGILAIDEMNRLYAVKLGTKHQRAGATKMTQINHNLIEFLVHMENEIGIPMVFIGTPEAETVLASGTFRQLRRSSRAGSMHWDRMAPDSDEWHIFLDALWRYQYVKHFTPLTEEFREAMYRCSAGIAGIAVSIFQLTQERAITNSSEKITPELVYRVFNDEFPRWVRPITALVQGDMSAIMEYEDLYFTGSLPVANISARTNKIDTSGQSYFQKDMTNKPASNSTNTQIRRRKRKNEREVKEGLLNIPDGHPNPYEAIKQAGFIRSALEYLA